VTWVSRSQLRHLAHPTRCMCGAQQQSTLLGSLSTRSDQAQNWSPTFHSCCSYVDVAGKCLDALAGGGSSTQFHHKWSSRASENSLAPRWYVVIKCCQRGNLTASPGYCSHSCLRPGCKQFDVIISILAELIDNIQQPSTPKSPGMTFADPCSKTPTL
jgi:hypothetical protein